MGRFGRHACGRVEDQTRLPLTNLGLLSDPDDPDSRVFTYSRKKVGQDLMGTQYESSEMYVKRLKKAMGWYSQPEVRSSFAFSRLVMGFIPSLLWSRL